MAELFPSSRSLLYPQFETYKLHPLEQGDNAPSYPLPGKGATQSRVGYNHHQLSFNEVRSRIAWDHLAIGLGGSRRGVYVDVEWNVVGFELNDDLEPVFSTLAQLPIPIASNQADQQYEFPSVVPISPTQWAIATGTGTLYILETTEPAPGNDSSFSGDLIARYDLSHTSHSSTSPFLLRGVHSLSTTDTRLLISRTASVASADPDAGPSTGQGRNKAFGILEVTLDPTRRNGLDNEPASLEPLWTLSGSDLPVWCGWWEEGWVVLSSHQFKSPDGEISKTATGKGKGKGKGAGLADPEDRSGVGAPSTIEAKSVSPIHPREESVLAPDDSKEWPFSWTQTSESLSVRFVFPSGISRSDIEIGLTATDFSLALKPRVDVADAGAGVGGSAAGPSAALGLFLRKASRSWWVEIDVGSTTYTFDPAKSQLDLEISKKDSHTRWPSVFTPADIEIDDDDEEEEEDVPETLDANTLSAVRETFNTIRTRDPESGNGNGTEPQGNHPAIPGLLREEMDFDLEDDDDNEIAEGPFGESTSKVGREVFVGYIKEGGVPSWSRTTTTVLSLPMNHDQIQFSGTGRGSSSMPPEIIVKSAVDGLSFRPSSGNPTDEGSGDGERTPKPGDPSKTPWEHTSTSPALAFVISSKRDIRLVRHIPSSTSMSPQTHEAKRAKLDTATTGTGTHTQPTVLAFDAGSYGELAQGNAYIYYPPISPTTAKQGVVGVSGREKGALLGVGCVRGRGGEKVVVVLCEKELVVLKGVV